MTYESINEFRQVIDYFIRTQCYYTAKEEIISCPYEQAGLPIKEWRTELDNHKPEPSKQPGFLRLKQTLDDML